MENNCIFYSVAAKNVTDAALKPYVDAAKQKKVGLRILLVPNFTRYTERSSLDLIPCSILDTRYQYNYNENPNIKVLDLAPIIENKMQMPIVLNNLIDQLNKYSLGGLQVIYFRLSPDTVSLVIW
jgi:hypothetical protein